MESSAGEGGKGNIAAGLGGQTAHPWGLVRAAVDELLRTRAEVDADAGARLRRGMEEHCAHLATRVAGPPALIAELRRLAPPPGAR